MHGDDVLLVTGPPLGPEGSLLDRVRAERRAAARCCPRCGARSIHCAIRKAIWQIRRAHPTLSSRRGAHAQRQGRTAGTHGGARAWACRRSSTRCTARRFIRIRAGGRGPSSAGASATPPRRCDALVSVADAMTDLLVAARVAPREKFTTVYSGMEVEPFLAADEHRAARARRAGLRRRARRGRQDRAAVSSQRPRVRGARGRSESSPSDPNVRFLFVGDGLLSETIRGAGSPRGT